MTYNFDQYNDRHNTYCTQWDYIEDRFGKKDLLPFSISDTDFIVPYPITKKLQECINHQIYGYTRWNHDAYKNAIASYFLRRHNTHIENSWILYSPTVMYSISLLLRLLCNPQDKVLTFEPMYDAFYSVIQENDRILVAHRLINNNGKYEIDFDLLEKQIKECKILLLCSPHNPTGRIWKDEEMKQMITLCKKYQVKIISDEIHMDIQIGAVKATPLMKYYDFYQEIYTASSSSKTFNTPALIGSYCILPNQDIYEKFLHHTRKADFLSSASMLGMHATITGYNECDDYIDELNVYIRKNMNYVEDFINKELRDFRFVKPDATYLAWIDARDVPFTPEKIQEALISCGVAIMKGDQYGDEQYLRMNLGCPLDKIKEGLKRFKKAVDLLYSEQC